MSGTSDPTDPGWGTPPPRTQPGGSQQNENQVDSPAPPTPARRPVDEIFDRIRGFGAVRPNEGRWVAGVASALADRSGIDQTLIRGIFVALSVIGGLGAGLYGIGWLLFPKEDGRIHLQEAVRGRFSAGFFAAVLLSCALIGGGSWYRYDGGSWGLPGALVLTALIVGGVWWLARNTPHPPGPGQGPGGVSAPTGQGTPTAQGPGGGHPAAGGPAATGHPHGTGQSDPGRSAHEEAAWQRQWELRAARARTAPSRRIRQLTLGLALIAAAGVLIAETLTDLPGSAGLTALAAALVVIACGVVANGLTGRRSAGLAGLGILLTVFLTIGTAAQGAGVQTGRHLAAIGRASWAPQTRADAQDQYNLGIGEAELDLTSAGVLSGATAQNPLEVDVNVGVGHLMLVLPEWMTVEVETRLGAGELVEPNGTTHEVRGNSANRSRTFTYGSGEADVTVVAQQGVGQLEIDLVSRSEGEN